MTDLSGYAVYFSRVMFAGPDCNPPADTHHAAFRKLPSERGLRLPVWTMSERFVHLPATDRRREVVIISGEDISLAGDTIAKAMRETGDGTITRDDVTAAHIELAKSRIGLETYVEHGTSGGQP